jgi:hypothetical protein
MREPSSPQPIHTHTFFLLLYTSNLLLFPSLLLLLSSCCTPHPDNICCTFGINDTPKLPHNLHILKIVLFPISFKLRKIKKLIFANFKKRFFFKS